jgi:Macrocin-O-methyltransferase (TylF)
MMAVALELAHLGASRTLYLFDTFDGMSEPSDVDQNLIGQSASELLQTEDKATSHNWAYCQEEDVFKNVSSTGYDMSHVRLVKGKVEDTVPKNAPEKIALLRLDYGGQRRHDLPDHRNHPLRPSAEPPSAPRALSEGPDATGRNLMWGRS